MSSFAGKRVLLAEDDASARRVIARALRQLGLEVIEAPDGGRMLVEITSLYKNGHTPSELDLIVTDVRMPIMSGLDAFKGIRAAHWRTPVIIVTAYESQEVRETVQRLSATLLIKPIDLDELEAHVRLALARSPTSGARRC